MARQSIAIRDLERLIARQSIALSLKNMTCSINTVYVQLK